VYLGAESKASVLWSGLYEQGAGNLIQLISACGCGSAKFAIPGVVLGFSRLVFRPNVYFGVSVRASTLFSGL